MMEQDAANMAVNEAIRLLFEGANLAITVTGKGAERVAAMMMAIMREQHKTKGAVRLANMTLAGGSQEVFSIPKDQLKLWAKHAKQYGVMYSVVRDKDRDGMVDLFVRAQDAPRINRIVERFNISGFDHIATVNTEGVPEAEFTEESKDEIDQIIDEILSPDGIDQLPPEPVQPEPTAAELHELSDRDDVISASNNSGEIVTGVAADFEIEEARSEQEPQPSISRPGTTDQIMDEVLTAAPAESEYRAAFENTASQDRNKMQDPSPALPKKEDPQLALQSEPKKNGVSKLQVSSVRSWQGEKMNSHEHSSHIGYQQSYSHRELDADEIMAIERMLAQPDIPNPEMKEIVISADPEGWPLQHPAADYSPKQRAEIQLCIDKGLSSSQIERIAQPEASPDDIKRMREKTRPSVRGAIQTAKQDHESSIKEAAAELQKAMNEIGKER